MVKHQQLSPLYLQATFQLFEQNCINPFHICISISHTASSSHFHKLRVIRRGNKSNLRHSTSNLRQKNAPILAKLQKILFFLFLVPNYLSFNFKKSVNSSITCFKEFLWKSDKKEKTTKLERIIFQIIKRWFLLIQTLKIFDFSILSTAWGGRRVLAIISPQTNSTRTRNVIVTLM